MNLSEPSQNKNQFRKEALFHDKWANSENVNDINVYNLFKSITAMENKFIVSHMGKLKNKKILDIGCGLGESAVYFALNGAEVTAADISPQMVGFAKELAKRYKVTIEFIVSSAEELNFKDESFDFIYCANLIHHIPVSDRPAFIKKIHKFFKKDGWFYSWDPLRYNPVINVYRKVANKVRSQEETPLDFSILKDFKRLFSRVHHKEFWLTTLVLFLKYYFVNRHDPNKIRYWKMIYREKPEDIGWWFNKFKKIDDVLLKLPLLKKLAWNILIYAQK